MANAGDMYSKEPIRIGPQKALYAAEIGYVRDFQLHYL